MRERLVLRLSSFLVFLFLILPLHSFGEFLIIQGSDQHSSYRKLPNFLSSIGAVSQEFKNNYPEGKVILLINGDYSSINSLSLYDKGTFSYRILARLAEKYHVIYSFGNHDALDWNDSQLFLNQMQILKSAGVHLVASNVSFYSQYRNLFQPHVDFVSSTGDVIRFANFAHPHINEEQLQGFQSKGPKIISKIHPMESSLNKFLEKANDSDVESVILATHFSFMKLKRILINLKTEHKKKIRLAFAAHDHKTLFSDLNFTYLIDSGAYFAFGASVLDNQGYLKIYEFYDHTSQKIINGINPQGLEARLIKEVRQYLHMLGDLKKQISPKKSRRNAYLKKSRTAVKRERKNNYVRRKGPARRGKNIYVKRSRANTRRGGNKGYAGNKRPPGTKGPVAVRLKRESPPPCLGNFLSR